MEQLQSEAEIGQRKVTELQRELKSCQHQLTQCLSEVEKGNSQRDKEIEELQEQVCPLSFLPSSLISPLHISLTFTGDIIKLSITTM